MRIVGLAPAPALALALTLALAGCKEQAVESPKGNEQAVIDKANQDVIEAEAEAAASAPSAPATSAP